MSVCEHGSAHDCRLCQEEWSKDKAKARLAFAAGFKAGKNYTIAETKKVEGHWFTQWWNDDYEAEKWKKLAEK